jgi:perosamine synthetase
MHPRHRIDASAADALFALTHSLAAPASRRSRRFPAPTGRTLTCLSVRSAFDLLLTALDLPVGDEILVSGITHPDMVRIIRIHGLQAVPIDVHPLSVVPRQDLLEAAITARTRAILVAHLFGARIELDGVAEVAARHRLLLVEDCAQSVRSADDPGEPRADASLFSFGFIKTATAFGGGRVRVRDAELAAGMDAIHRRWPIQSRTEYAGKALRGLATLVLTQPLVYGATIGRDPDRRATRFARSFPAEPDDAFLAAIRRQPGPALQATLDRRLRRFPADRLRRRAEAGDRLVARLPPGLEHPGGLGESSHWLVPFVTDRPGALIAHLRARGFDATQGASQIAVVPAPSGYARFEPHQARELMARIVFVPAYPELSAPEFDRLVRALHDFAAGV